MDLRRKRIESQDTVREILHPTLVRLWSPPFYSNCLIKVINDLYNGQFSMVSPQSSQPLHLASRSLCSWFSFYLVGSSFSVSFHSFLLFSPPLRNRALQGSGFDSLLSTQFLVITLSLVASLSIFHINLEVTQVSSSVKADV